MSDSLSSQLYLLQPNKSAQILYKLNCMTILINKIISLDALQLFTVNIFHVYQLTYIYRKRNFPFFFLSLTFASISTVLRLTLFGLLVEIPCALHWDSSYHRRC